MKHLRHQIQLGLMAAAIVALTACGGGGADNPGSNATVRGVAATGAAIANAQVSLKCSTGTASTTTQADGSFSVDVSKVTLPCVARVEFTDASTGKTEHLFSLVQAAGTVNITPVTDMVVANLTATGVAADAFDNFSATELKSLTADRVKTASLAVRSELQAAGVDVTHLPDDAIGATLVAASKTTKGDAHDAVLDELKAKLQEKGKTLHDLETEMHSGHEDGHSSTSTGTAGDPVKGKTAYDAHCAGCHGARMSDAVNAAKILAAIKENEGGMGTLAGTVTTTMADDIATYMATLIGSRNTIKTQTITFASPGNQTLGVATPALVASASSGLAVTIASSTPAVCTVSGTSLTLVAAGTCTLSASQAGNASFSAAAPVVRTFSVAASNGTVLPSQTITFASPGAQVVGTTVTLSASASSGLAVTLASTTPTICTVSGSTLTPIAVGNCSVTANQAGNASFAAAATVTRTFAVTNPAAVPSATNGKALYASTGCGSCHGTPPATQNVLNGANNPTLLQGAISANRGGMGKYATLTSQDLIDIAAYLATPSI